MRAAHLWNKAREIKIQTSPEIVGNFDVGFDQKILEETKDALMQFVYWVEDHFSLPITLWVDFKYNHYLLDKEGKRVGYKFYWVDFRRDCIFDNFDDIPVIELPVRTERWTMEEILRSFIEAITRYFLWLTNDMAAELDGDEVEEVLQTYLHSKETV